MRIIAGEWRGRTIKAPSGKQVRPTADRAREAWMSTLQHDIPDARVVDLCAGSGALGLEALSRGAASCDFVDLSEPALRMIRENIATLGAGERSHVHRADALRFVRKPGSAPWDIAFSDPPYHLGIAQRLAEAWLAAPFSRILTLEHEIEAGMPPGGTTRKYGGTGITTWRRAEATEG